MKRAILSLIAIASLSACSDPPKVWTEAEIQDIAGDAAGDSDHEDRIAELETRLDDLEAQIASLGVTVDANARAHESLRGTFNSNVDLVNRQRAAERTARGDCGYDQVPVAAGIAFKPKPC